MKKVFLVLCLFVAVAFAGFGDNLNDDFWATIGNILLYLVPAIAAFFVGVKKFSGKALKFVALAKTLIDLVDSIVSTTHESSDGGTKITSSEIKVIRMKIATLKKEFYELKGDVLVKKA